MPGDQGAFRGRAQAGGSPGQRQACPHRPITTTRPRGPKAPTRPELWEDVAEISRARPTVRPQADRDVPARREGRLHSRQDRAQDHARDGHQLRHKARDRLPQVQLLQRASSARRSRTCSAATSPPTGRGRSRGPTSPSSSRAGAAHLAPAYDFGGKEIVAWSISEHPDMMQQKEMLAMLLPKVPAGSSPVMQSDMGGNTSTSSTAMRSGKPGDPEHVAQGKLHRQRGDGTGCSATSRTSSSRPGVPRTSRRSNAEPRSGSATPSEHKEEHEREGELKAGRTLKNFRTNPSCEVWPLFKKKGCVCPPQAPFS